MTRPIYRFGDYRIDPSARELQHAGELVVLSPKVFDSLAYLIEHRDRAVGRDELIAAVWGKTDVTDTLLGQTVLKARRAIGDTGNDQKAIRTIPRFGYRWVGDLQVVDPPPTEADYPEPAPPPPDHQPITAPNEPVSVTATAPTAAASSRTWARQLVALAAVLVVAAAFLVWFLGQRSSAPAVGASTGADASKTESIAVLPVNVAAGDEWAWLRLGIMDLVGSRLRRGGLTVVPSDNVVAAARAPAGAEEARDSGNAENAVKTRTGAQQTLTTQLERVGQQWQLRFELHGTGARTTELQALGTDPIEVARSASDRLLAALGKSIPADDPAELSLAALTQRVEAALLIDDFATARRQIETASPEQREAPILRLRLAQIDFRAGALGAAREKLESLLTVVSAESDAVLRARILHTLGAIAIRDTRNSDAMNAFEESVHLTETRNEPGVLGKAYVGLGVALRGLDRYDDAAAAYARARVALTLAGDVLGLSGLDDNEGLLDNARGRPAEALIALRRAADTERRFGLVNDLALVVSAQIDTHLLLLDPAAALLTAEEFLPLRNRITNPRGRNSFDFRHARALTATGRMSEASARLDEIEQSEVAASQVGLGAVVTLQRALIDLAGEDKAAAAVPRARKAQAELASLQLGDVNAEAWTVLIRALRASGQYASARSEVERFGQWALTVPELPHVQLLSTLANAEHAWNEQRGADADRFYSSALEQAERRSVPEDTTLVATSWGSALIADKNLERASIVAGRAARWATQDFDCALLQVRLYHALGHEDAWRAAVKQARALAGERRIPDRLALPPEHPEGSQPSASTHVPTPLADAARMKRE